MRQLGVRQAADITILHEFAADVTVVDVSDAAAPIDRDALDPHGEAVLVCFGSHGHGSCPLNGAAAPGGATHGVVLDIERRADHQAFLDRFRQLVRPDVPIRVANNGGDRLPT